MSRETLTHDGTSGRAIRLADGRRLSLARPLIMGTLNVTPDSFSDGGRHTSRSMAIGRALEMEGEGADIIDVGGESTRPGAAPVDVDEEMRRVLPVIEGIRKASDIPISIDTYKAITAKAALDAGADIINDVSGLRFDEEMAGLVAARGVPVVIMHMKGTPRDMQKNPRYDDCLAEITAFFRERIVHAERQGIAPAQIIIDPGIGFGKRLEDNLEILANLGRFRDLGFPLLVGPSRKRFIAMIHPSSKPADQRLGGSIAAVVAAALGGADIVRVHDIDQTMEALRVAQALRGAVR
ncbi:MAG TPA: dihydropteroate synthase [candidate division Zixibacteria bacterium]|nr:dihydropteroate synthase [candidate division Zixibacteria bacterium]MDD4916425.1 dihydropteroate synthase [candidate division Zixibacteria bacterium]MDM7972564.1 dihydropteroate synthase [candidate division Zixibacteria bacterium]HOD65650.1 dihydropteroate synthase [candidate division Zixibacteria bacterium]HPI33040.1 dihydropteroate synthase [candidate division Zixibacteria bacterium]